MSVSHTRSSLSRRFFNGLVKNCKVDYSGHMVAVILYVIVLLLPILALLIPHWSITCRIPFLQYSSELKNFNFLSICLAAILGATIVFVLTSKYHLPELGRATNKSQAALKKQ